MALIDITPVMTSNNTPTPYVVGTSTVFNSSFEGYKLFNNTLIDTNDGWLASGVSGAMAFDFGVPTQIRAFSLTARMENSSTTTTGYSTVAPKSFALYGSNSSMTTGFELLYSGDNEIYWNSKESRMFKLKETYSYRYYKLIIISNNGHASSCGLGLFKFYQDDGTTPVIENRNNSMRYCLPHGSKLRLDNLTSDLTYMLATESDGDNEGTLRIVDNSGKFIVPKAGQKLRKLWSGVATTVQTLTLDDMIENYSSIVLVANYATGTGAIEGKTTISYPVAEAEYYDSEFILTLSLYSGSTAKVPYIYFKMKNNQLTITSIGTGGYQLPRLISVYGIY